MALLPRWSTESSFCFNPIRDREAGKGFHTGPGRAVGRGRLQLWRAGGLCACVWCVSGAWTHLSFCSPSWCILCWSLWGTRTSSGSLILFTPSMEETWRSFRATSLPGASRWVETILEHHEILDRLISIAVWVNSWFIQMMHLFLRGWRTNRFPIIYQCRVGVSGVAITTFGPSCTKT